MRQGRTGHRGGHHEHHRHDHDHGEHGHRGSRGGSGRRRRMFDSGELQVLLLSFLVDEPRHGYELIREIESLSQGGYSPSPGVVYPALTFMQEAGFVQIASEEGGRRSYVATAEGKAQIAEKAVEIERAKARLAMLADQRERTDAAPIRRAMQNLKTAIFDRLSRENVDRAAIIQVAGFIDDAARQIEGADA